MVLITSMQVILMCVLAMILLYRKVLIYQQMAWAPIVMVVQSLFLQMTLQCLAQGLVYLQMVVSLVMVGLSNFLLFALSS